MVLLPADTPDSAPSPKDAEYAKIVQLQELLLGAEALLEERARRLEEAICRLQQMRIDHEAEVERIMRAAAGGAGPGRFAADDPPAVVERLVRSPA